MNTYNPDCPACVEQRAVAAAPTESDLVGWLLDEIAHAKSNGFRIEHHRGPGEHSVAVPVEYLRAVIERYERGRAL